MKKFILIFILLLMPFTLFACDLNFSGTSTDTKTSYKITFDPDNGEGKTIVNAEKGELVELPEEPTKDGYDFVAWEDAKGTEYDKSFKASKDLDLKAIYEQHQLTYTFQDDEGNVISTGVGVSGDKIEYPADPVKEATDEATFEFIGWDKNDEILTKDIIFTAKFSSTSKYATYKFVVDGKTVKEEKVLKGSTISYPEDPEKAATKEFTYTFIGWSNDATICNEDITFTAVFDSTKNSYTIIFKNDDGTVLSTQTVEYGKAPKIPDTPTKEADETYTYTFKSWDKMVVSCNGDATYTATYTSKKIASSDSLEGRVISFLGDSITTFYAPDSPVNSYYHEDGRYYYPTYCQSVRTVDKTWWYQLYTNTGMELGINNAWSGSTAYGTSNSCGMHDDRINTLDDNGAPDIVIVFLGTNDAASIYEDTYTLANYKLALETIVEKINALCDADIFFATLSGLSTYKSGTYLPRAYQFNEVIEEVATENGCGIIPIHDYITPENDVIYFNDNLHFNYKGTTLVAKICEKHIKEYYGIEFDEKLNIEYPEVLPEGVVAYAEADAYSNFWKDNNYVSHKYLSTPSQEASIPLFSYRIQIKQNANGNYYVYQVNKEGDTATYDYDYIYYVSSSYTEFNAVKGDLKDVKVGCLVEFDSLDTYPVKITFKENDGTVIGGGEEPVTPPVQDDTPVYQNGVLHVSKYNDGVWSVYGTEAMIYSYAGLNQGSTYINFYKIAITKDGDNYKVVDLSPSGQASSFPTCDYFILIYNALDAKEFYQNLSVGDYLSVTGSITDGNASFQKIA